MAALTIRLGVGTDGNFAAMNEVDQTAASRTDGWTVAKNAAGLSSEYDVGVKQASGTFSSQSTTPKPASFLTGSTANAFKSAAAYKGVFAAAAWTLTFAVRAGTASSQAGRMRVRVFKSANASGASATELTGSTQVGTTSAALSTTADVTSVVTWTPASAITMNDEYLFVVLAWETTTASGSNSGDVLIRTGQSAGGSRIVTSAFSAEDAATVSVKVTPSAVEVPPTLPFVDTLKDTFDTQIDSTVWKDLTGSTPPVWDASGAARLSTPTGGGGSNLATGAGSVYSYNMTGKEVFAKIGLPADWTTRSGDGGHNLTFLISSPIGQVSIQTQLAASPPGIIFDAGGAFNIAMSINYLWWKISESGGVITYWTSPDGINWTSRGSHSPVFDPTNVRIAFNSGGIAAGFPTNIFIDNVNVSPVFKSLVAAPRSNPYRQLTRWHS